LRASAFPLRECRSAANVFSRGRGRSIVRLVLACHSYFPAIGGVERFVQGLGEELARRGVEVIVVTRLDPGTRAEETLNGVRLVRIPMRRVGRFHVPRGYLRTLRELRPDVFHLIGNRVWCADFFLPRVNSLPCPRLMTGHGFYQYEMRRRLWDRWYFERYLPGRIRQLDRYTADTVHERDQLTSWGVDPRKIEIIPAAVSLEEFSSPRAESAQVRAEWGMRAPLVGIYVGGYYENKRVDRLVRAVAQTGGRWGLVAAGRDVPGTPYDRATIARMGESTHAEVLLRETLPRPQVLDGLAAADAVLLGSSYEGFGILLLEAMASGRPFVAYRTGAAPELAATGSGFCVDTDAEFVEALRQLEDPELRRTMGARGRQAVEQYSTPVEATRFLAAYQQLVVRRPGAA